MHRHFQLHLHTHSWNPHDPLSFLPSYRVEWRVNIQTRGQSSYLHVLCMYNLNIKQFRAMFKPSRNLPQHLNLPSCILWQSSTSFNLKASHWCLHWNQGPSMLTDSVGWSPLEEIRRMDRTWQDNSASQALLWKNRPFSSNQQMAQATLNCGTNGPAGRSFPVVNAGWNLSNASAGKSCANYWAWDGPH